MYDAERADVLALEQLEAVLREVAEELATWRARALKAEGHRGGSGGGGGRGDGDGRGRAAELEVENRQLRTRVDAARNRVQELLARLAFLEEQSREGAAAGGANGGGSGSGRGAAR
ncbi:MAG TPA: hypothetical protein VKP10_10560 [Gemmatimonadales bacterium]|nr:hypothetical protein [Gemmatimonadales bacterium]